MHREESNAKVTCCSDGSAWPERLRRLEALRVSWVQSVKCSYTIRSPACVHILWICVALAQAGCRQESPVARSGADEVQSVASSLDLSVVSLEQSEVVEPIYVTGTVLAYKTTDLVPMVGGMVEEILVRVGDRVEKGQPLLRMRHRDFEIRVERLRHAVDLASAEQRNARTDYESGVKLAKRGGLSLEQLDDRRTRFQSTSAQLGIARADLAEAELALEDAITRAPYDGVITQRNVDEGAYVSSFMRTSEPVMQIQKIDIMVALIFVPEAHINSIRLGTPGKVTIPGLTKSYDTEVHLINDRIDMTTRSIDVRLGIPNQDYEIKPGLFIEVELYPDPRSAWTAPLDVVRGLGGERYVFVAQHGVARRRDVRIRELENGRVEILSGVEPGELIIRGADLHLLQDNARLHLGGSS